ncbi:hypothetical protein DSM21852_40510 [Methylocystis bryophila]|uniref:Uncharacterized protein n=2 Tax=Methylocystis bryophila TaxID=655015 RepID=A0A1W6MT42_9HYPH|nr:hypothetical protein B1812_06160 [Methylocystis bryophila]BDV40798.1 hypothetical protein DSM21852_40510 [Methylocystis bryophila]
MTAAGVRFREEFQKYNRKLYEGLEKGSPAFNEAGRLSADCYWLIYSRFYVKFRNVIDKLNTSPLKYPDDIDEGRGDEIIHDPKKIVVLTRKVIGDIWYLEGTGRSAGDFAAEYARRPEFEKKCEGYLDATGLR